MEMPPTTRAGVVHQVAVRELHVLRTSQVTPGMRRVTLTGEQLGAFTRDGERVPEFRSSGFDDDVRLIFGYPGEDSPVLPTQRNGRLIFEEGRRQRAKTYTVRRWDPANAQLDLDFVLHGDGVATEWALACAPGDRLHIAGPIRSRHLPLGTDWLLVGGDETALPAIGRLLEDLPTGTRAQVFIEVAKSSHRQELRSEADVRITWLSREGAPPGSTALLFDAVRRAQWWPGRPYVWIAGEAMNVSPIRRYLRDDRGLPPEDIEVTGYWRRSATLSASPTDSPAATSRDSAFTRLHTLTELLAPFALRAAVTLGVPEAIARGHDEPSELAAEVGAEPVALRKLLRYLHSLDVVTRTPSGRYGLSEVGALLTHEVAIGALDLDAPHPRQELGFAGLAESVRTGRSSYRSVFGVDFTELRADPAFEAAFLEGAAKYTQPLAPALAEERVLGGIDHVVVHGNGSGVVAQAITAATPHRRVTLVGSASQIAYLRADLAASVHAPGQRDRIALVERSAFDPSPSADAVLFVQALGPHPDPDAARILRRTAEGVGPDGLVLVVEYPLEEDNIEGLGAGEDLRNLVLYGSGHRTDEENRALFDAAGLHLASTATLGWGHTLYRLAPAAALRGRATQQAGVRAPQGA
jgi:NADPH-dependent ferric siderophore reductase